MEKSESIVNLVKALMKAQGEFTTPILDKTNKHLNYSYASFQSVRNATMPALISNGLTLNFYPATIDNVNYIEAMLIHVSGEYILSRYKVEPEKPGMQGVGAAWTYLKRYIWGSVLSLYDTEDDDAVADNLNPEKIGETAYETKKTQPKAQPQSDTISKEQVEQLKQAASGHPDLLAQVLEGAKRAKLEEIPSKLFGNFLGFITQSVEARNKKK